MSNEELIPLSSAVDQSKVAMVYSGKPGCACGCRGSYYHNTNVTLEQIAKSRGYAAEQKEINKGQVTRVVNKINDNLSTAQADKNGVFAEVEVNGRVYRVYFTLDTLTPKEH